jgi:hypothetical protein
MHQNRGVISLFPAQFKKRRLRPHVRRAIRPLLTSYSAAERDDSLNAAVIRS